MSELRELDIQVAVDANSYPDLNVSIDEESTDISVEVEEIGGFVTRNYEKLDNRPQINGVTLTGNQTAGDLLLVRRGTRQEWDDQRDYIPLAGQIIIYTDYPDIERPSMKVGDGKAYLIDLPFLSEGVTLADRQIWSNKLNCELIGEELIFNRS